MKTKYQFATDFFAAIEAAGMEVTTLDLLILNDLLELKYA